MAYNALFDTLRRIETAVNPHQFNAEWLRLLSNPQAVAQLAQRGGTGLESGAQQLLQDSFEETPWSYGANAPRPDDFQSQIVGGQEAGYTPPNIPEPQAGVKLGQDDALGNIRRLEVAADPFQTLQQRNQFLTNPAAQGAAEGLRRRATGGQLQQRQAQSTFNRMGDASRQRITGEASAFGLGPSQLKRSILGNTLAGRSRQQRSGYESL